MGCCFVQWGIQLFMLVAFLWPSAGCSRDQERPAVPTEQRASNAPSKGPLAAAPLAATVKEVVPTGLDSPVNFEFADGDGFYVLGQESLLHLGLDGKQLARRELDGLATALALTEDEILVAVDGALGRVSRADLGGEMKVVQLPKGTLVTGIAVRRGEVFLADSAGRRLLRLGAERVEPIPLVGPEGEELRLVVPSPYLEVRVGEGGVLLSNNPGAHQILGLSPGGSLSFAWGEAGSAAGSFCGCCGPISYDALAGGQVVTAEKGCRRVQLFDASGEWQGVIADSGVFQAAERVCELRGIEPTERWLRVRGGAEDTVWVLERCTGDLFQADLGGAVSVTTEEAV
jgi:hypothetical protein